MKAVMIFFQIIGSLGLFLYGMKLLSEGLQKSAGNRMKAILNMMTKNRFISIMTGVIITVIIQSSSATTVMVVSFVNAGLMELVQAIGVILGANIGTTVTGWIVALLGFKMNISLLSYIDSVCPSAVVQQASRNRDKVMYCWDSVSVSRVELHVKLDSSLSDNPQARLSCHLQHKCLLD